MRDSNREQVVRGQVALRSLFYVCFSYCFSVLVVYLIVYEGFSV